MEIKYETREQWLEAAVVQLKRLIPAKYNVPAVRVSLSWPSSKGLGTKKRAIGECWSKDCSADGLHQLFISPLLEDPLDPYGVLATELHELGHAIVGVECGHKKPFKDFVRDVGLEGKATSTFAGEKLIAEFKVILAELGPYPHVKIDPKFKGGKKPQKNRQLKLECGCGFICRASRKAIDEHGTPICGRCKVPLVEVDGEAEEPEDGE